MPTRLLLRAATLAAIVAAPAGAAAAPLRAEVYQSQLGTTPVWIATDDPGLPSDPAAADLTQLVRWTHAMILAGAPEYAEWPAWSTFKLIYDLRVHPSGDEVCPPDAEVPDAYAAIVDAAGALRSDYRDGDSFVAGLCAGNEGEMAIGGHELGHALVWRALPLDGGDQVPGRSMEALALYESYADIIGATLVIARDPYADPDYCGRHPCPPGALAARTSCTDASRRWRIRVGDRLARDLWDPTCEEALQRGPARADSDDYVCLGDASFSHVYHRNSLIHSRAYALFADVVGVDLAFAVFMRALRDGTDEATTFAAQAGHLRAACAALQGAELRALATGEAIPGPDAATCAELDAAIEVVGMTQPVRCPDEVAPAGGCCSTHPPRPVELLVVALAALIGRRRRAPAPQRPPAGPGSKPCASKTARSAAWTSARR